MPDSEERTATRAKPGEASWPMLVATFFGVGRLRPGPGTWASAATTLLWAAVANVLPAFWRTPIILAVIVVITLLGIPAATRVARASGLEDPQFVVIDEVAGQLLALTAAPLSWKTFLAGFILFRGFDIVKPPPVRQLEKLPEGTGIVLDDLAAGAYAWMVLHLLMYFRLLR